MTTNPFDPNQLFDADYFRYGFGGIPYERSAHWVNFFRAIAGRIMQDLAPRTVLDAGCGIGLLVESLRDQHIDARGFDIADYAIEQIPSDLQPYIQHASITDSDAITDKFDLTICIEVVEHLLPQDADSAIDNLCKSSNTILFSSSPSHFDEATHFNIQSPGYWVEKFARNGFFPVLDYDASYITAWAMLFRRETPIWPSILRRYADHAWTKSNQAHDLRQLVNTIQHTRYANEQTIADLQAQLQRQKAEHDAELASLHETVRHFQQAVEQSESQREQITTAFDVKEAELRHQLATQQNALSNVQHEHGQLVANYAALEADLRQQLHTKQTMIDDLQNEREHVVAQYEAVLLDLHQQVKDQQAAIEHVKAEQGRQLARHEAIETELRQRIHDQQTIIENAQIEQGRLIGSHDQIETHYTQKLADLQSSRQSAEQANAQLLHSKNELEAHLRHELATQRATIDDLHRQAETTTAHFQSQIADLNNQLTFAHTNIDLMRNTRGWRFLDSWWRFKKRWFPPHSFRERIYILIRSAFEILLAYGPWALVKRIRSWFRNRRRIAHLKRQIAAPIPTSLPNPIQSPASRETESDSGFLFYTLTDKSYAAHVKATEPSRADLEAQIDDAADWDENPIFDIVTPVYQPPLSIFKETVQSVQTQTYPHWVWHVVDASQDDTIWQFLVQKSKEDLRLKPVRLAQNLGISGNTNIGLRQATGDYVVLLDHDDTLAPHALFSAASVIRDQPAVDFIYSDVDKLNEKGQRCEPLFKPDWSPELFLSFNLLGHLSIFRRTLLDRVGLLDESLDGAQDWDLFLRISEHTDAIHHIPQVLYHWRKVDVSMGSHEDAKPYVTLAQQTAVANHLCRLGITDPHVIFDKLHPIYQSYPLVTWAVSDKPKISIIIPTCDHLDVLQPCIESIFRLTDYDDYEIVVVDTGSSDPATHQFYQQYSDHSNFKLVTYTKPFNFSAVCNVGARNATGDLFLFLNNDTLVIQRDWLSLMAQWFELDDIGIVGPKLLYPTGRIQHAGVVVGFGGLASHLFRDQNEAIGTIFGTDGWYRNFLAVTGACMMIARDVFEMVDGYDEKFQLNYSDVDLCLRVHASGYRILYTPHVRLTHYESITHQRLIPRADFERAATLWKQWLQNEDPYFNPNLTYTDDYPTFRRGPQDTPANLNADLMRRLPNKRHIKLPEDIV